MIPGEAWLWLELGKLNAERVGTLIRQHLYPHGLVQKGPPVTRYILALIPSPQFSDFLTPHPSHQYLCRSSCHTWVVSGLLTPSTVIIPGPRISCGVILVERDLMPPDSAP